jgi:hypothetical protein
MNEEGDATILQKGLLSERPWLPRKRQPRAIQHATMKEEEMR